MSGDLSKVKVTGPLVPYVGGFSTKLQGSGYQPGTVVKQVRLLAHVSRWLEVRNLVTCDLIAARVEEFLVEGRDATYAKRYSTSTGLAPLLGYLRSISAIPLPIVVPTTPSDDLLFAFRTYLLNERGVAGETAGNYVRVARSFLDEYAIGTDVDLGDLARADVLRFVAEQCRRHSPNRIATGLRAFLRYCHVEGLTTGSLADVIPTVANRRLSSLPQGLEPERVRSLLESCDQSTAMGARNFAILTVLIRLGLRASEVANLELDDINWRSAEIVVRGKGPRVDRLPLPVDVGEAIMHWLAHGRPRCEHPNVFIRLIAPLQPLTHMGVSGVVTSACHRAHIPEVRAHRLRRTAATTLLHAESNLREIGELLRHHNLQTTAIYAKTDDRTLLEVAQPWPGSAS
jgi:integrase/recombinase XerD